MFKSHAIIEQNVNPSGKTVCNNVQSGPTFSRYFSCGRATFELAATWEDAFRELPFFSVFYVVLSLFGVICFLLSEAWTYEEPCSANSSSFNKEIKVDQ